MLHDRADADHVGVGSALLRYPVGDCDLGSSAFHGGDVETPVERRSGTEPPREETHEGALLVAADFHFLRLDHAAVREAEEESGEIHHLGAGGIIENGARVPEGVFDVEAHGDLLAGGIWIVSERPARYGPVAGGCC